MSGLIPKKNTGAKQDEKINPMLKMMMKQFLPLINEKISEIDPALKHILQRIDLQDGEETAVFMIAVNPEDDTVYIMTSCLNYQNKVVRVVSRQKITDFISELLQKSMQ